MGYITKKIHELFADHTRLVVKLTVLAFAFAQVASAALTNRYVVKDNAGSAVPYDAWANAAANIQTAIDYAYAGETVLVAAATYDTGGLTNYPAGTILTNRVAIWKAITVMSANNDPTNTIIKGAMDNGTNGPASVRCVYMAAGSALIGFTLTNGATLQANYLTTGTNENHNGGGVWCQNITATISNCLIIGNMSAWYGGGAYSGTLYNCTLRTNALFAVPSSRQCWGAGANGSILSNCTLINNWGKWGSSYGGAAQGGYLYNCTLIGNVAGMGGGTYGSFMYNCMIISNYGGSGGGVRRGALYNCLLKGNSASSGGGAYQGTLYNCTVVGNSASSSGGGLCGSGGEGVLNNCIVYFNSSPSGSNWVGTAGLFLNTCTAPSSNAWTVGNITDNPQFVDTNTANYRLNNNSPCINGGTNGSWTTDYPYDLDGRARIRYGRVDMGAYERLHKGTVCGVH